MATTVASFKIHRYDDFHPLGHDGSTKELWNYGPMLSKYQLILYLRIENSEVFIHILTKSKSMQDYVKMASLKTWH
ncbi:hypothetical protein CGCF413_v014015 [Colletotrichum fructicola]|nr:hypothetical protein CGCF413_v014015 [Colletotrichum fructicola]